MDPKERLKKAISKAEEQMENLKIVKAGTAGNDPVKYVPENRKEEYVRLQEKKQFWEKQLEAIEE